MTDKPVVKHAGPPPLDPPPDWEHINLLLNVADKARLWPRLNAMGSEAMLELEYAQESIVEAREEATEAAAEAAAKEKADAEAKAAADAAKPVSGIVPADKGGSTNGKTNP